MPAAKEKAEAGLTVIRTQPLPVVMDDERLALIGSTLAPDLTASELRLFGEVSTRSGLDPFAKQIFAIKRKGRVTFQTSIDGYRSIAARTGEYDGQDEPVYGEPCPCNQAPPKHPLTATVRVYRKGMTRGVAATAFWHEYRPDEAFMWNKMPHVMLAKVAEALALRKAFPYVMADLYTSEEMEQAEPAAPRRVSTGDPYGNEEEYEPPAPTPVARIIPEQALGDGPEAVDGTYVGKVLEPPEVKEVKRPDWITDVPPSTKMPKSELKFSVAGSKHTAIIVGDAAFAIVEANIGKDEEVRVIGQLHLHPWAEGKPPMKQIRFVQSVDVMREGAWESVVTTPEDVLVPDAVVVDDATGQALEIFGDDLLPPTVEEMLQLPPASGTGTLDTLLTLVTLEWKGSDSKRFAVVKASDGDSLYSLFMQEDEAIEQLILHDGEWRFAPGERVSVLGEWVVARGTPVVLLTAMREAI